MVLESDRDPESDRIGSDREVTKESHPECIYTVQCPKDLLGVWNQKILKKVLHATNLTQKLYGGSFILLH